MGLRKLNGSSKQALVRTTRVDWLDRTVGPRTGRTGLICKQSSPEFRDRTELQSQNPLGPDCTTVRSRNSGLNCNTVPMINWTGPYYSLVFFFGTEPYQSGRKRPDGTVIDT